MPVTNEDIMKELKKVEEKLDKIEHKETELEAEEKKEMKEIEESTINLEFPNIEDWRKYIWSDCEFKEERSEGDEVDFFCKKQNGPCKFDGCPLNYKKAE